MMKNNVLTETDGYGRTSLHYAKSVNEVRASLGAGCGINAQDRNGWAALHFAAQDNRHEVLVLLLQNGADPNLRDVHGNGPLWTATMNARGYFRCVRELLAAGAEPDEVNLHGRTPRMMAETIGHSLEAVFGERKHMTDE